MRMKTPCEVVIWHLLPRIRALLAKELMRLGFSQREVGRRLGITPAAVSQYISEKRAGGKGFDPEIMQAIEELAKDIAAE